MGTYALDRDTVNVIKKGAGMYLDFGYMQWQMHFTAPADFFVYDAKADMHFIKEADGAISGIKIDNGGIAKRIK